MQEQDKWKRYQNIIQNYFEITDLGNSLYTVELPALEHTKHIKLQKWQEKRIKRKLIELLKAKKGRIVLAKIWKEKDWKLEEWQIQENLKLPFLYAMIEFYLEAGNVEKQEVDLYFLCKEFSKETVSIVKRLAKEYRSVNIVSDEILGYRKIADKVYEQNAQLITVSNNRKKALKSAKLIINYDMKEEEIVAYNINRESSIMNIQTTIKKMPIGFCKLIINDILLKKEEDAEIPLENKGFEIEDMISSILYKESNREEKQNIMEKLGVKIQAFKGLNGTIDQKELEKLAQKLLTK